MFEIKTPDGFTFVKQLSCRKEYCLGFSYFIENINIIQDSEGNRFVREYRNDCDTGANGRPVTTITDVGYKIEREVRISRIDGGNWKTCIPRDELYNPSIVFERAGGTYVDQAALDFVKKEKDSER